MGTLRVTLLGCGSADEAPAERDRASYELHPWVTELGDTELDLTRDYSDDELLRAAGRGDESLRIHLDARHLALVVLRRRLVGVGDLPLLVHELPDDLAVAGRVSRGGGGKQRHERGRGEAGGH